jgi:hypothetical protein
MWFDEGHTVYAGVMKNNPNDWMLIDTYARAVTNTGERGELH